MNADMQSQPVRGKVVWGARIRLAVALACALVATSSCGQAVRTGQASSYLILTSLQSSAGSTVVQSDVQTGTPPTTSVVSDPATAAFELQMKDVTGLGPSPNNAITITQYHVKFTRTDGRNAEGVDVPYAFDGAVTTTISSAGSVGFTLVRSQAKLEAPLAALAQTNIPVTTIATVTFYGHDQVGREVSVTGSIEVTFANFPG